MRIATFLVLVGTLALAAPPTMAAVSEGKIAVVRVTAIDGLAHTPSQVTQTRTTAFTYDGTNYTIDSGAVGGLDGVQTLVLIDRRVDSVSGDSVIRQHSQEVRAVRGTHFEVKDLPNKTLSYQVASIAGNLRLEGDGDQILCTGGEHGAYHIWRVDGIQLLDKSAIRIR